MKKKIKDITISEAKAVCNKFYNCTKECPFKKFSCLDIMYLTKTELEEEVELDVVGNTATDFDEEEKNEIH